MTTQRWKWTVAGVLATVGALQAWDSGAFAAGAGWVASALAVAAVALPPAVVLLSDRTAVHLAAIIAAAVLFVTARVVSPAPLPELLLAAVFPALLLFVWTALRARRESGGVTSGR